MKFYGKIVSVPSRGILFPNQSNSFKTPLEKCFRPLSGYLISKYFKVRDRNEYYGSFRPLSGYLISKCDVGFEYETY